MHCVFNNKNSLLEKRAREIENTDNQIVETPKLGVSTNNKNININQNL